MSIGKEEIDQIIVSESLSRTYYFMTTLIRTIVLSFVIGIVSISMAFFITQLNAFLLVLLLAIIFFYMYAKTVRVINDSSNEIWSVYWRYFSQFLRYHNVSEDRYAEFVNIFWNYKRIFGLASAITFGIFFFVIYLRNFSIVFQIFSVLFISLLEALFIRELILPRIKLKFSKLFLEKIERLQSYKRNNLYLLIASSIIFNFNLLWIDKLKEIIWFDNYLLYVSYLAHFSTGLLLGVAYIYYYKFAFEVTYFPMKHPLFDIMTLFFIATYIFLNVVVENQASMILMILYTSLSAFALTLSYGYFAISCWNTIYVTFTSIKDIIREESPKKRIFDVYTMDSKRFIFMSLLSPALIGVLFMCFIEYSDIVLRIPGVKASHLFGGIGILMGFLIGSFFGYSRAIPNLMMRIKEQKYHVLKYKMRIEKKKAEREAKVERKRAKIMDKEKLEVSEKDEYERWIKEFNKLARLLEEES